MCNKVGGSYCCAEREGSHKMHIGVAAVQTGAGEVLNNATSNSREDRFQSSPPTYAILCTSLTDRVFSTYSLVYLMPASLEYHSTVVLKKTSTLRKYSGGTSFGPVTVRIDHHVYASTHPLLLPSRFAPSGALSR